MERFTIFPVCACIGLLSVGMGVAKYAPNIGSSLHWRGVSYGVSTQVLIFGSAAIFCLLATLYSVRQIPINELVAKWHFWLSLTCVIFYLVCQLLFSKAVASGTLTKASTLAYASLSIVLVPVFCVVQFSILLEVVRALVRLRDATR
jgi:hypothetical protein